MLEMVRVLVARQPLLIAIFSNQTKFASNEAQKTTRYNIWADTLCTCSSAGQSYTSPVPIHETRGMTASIAIGVWDPFLRYDAGFSAINI